MIWSHRAITKGPDIYQASIYALLDKVERKFINRSQENSNAESREDSNSPSGNIIGRNPHQR